MDEKFRSQMEENGADVETTLKRFMGNETLYMKFIMKFLNDKSFDGIKETLEKKDYEEAFKHAHTLKGVTANLGLNPINSVVAEMAELLRGKSAEEVNIEEVRNLEVKLEEAYHRICNILIEYQNSH